MKDIQEINPKIVQQINLYKFDGIVSCYQNYTPTMIEPIDKYILSLLNSRDVDPKNNDLHKDTSPIVISLLNITTQMKLPNLDSKLRH